MTTKKSKTEKLVAAQIAREKLDRAAPDLLASLIELEKYMTDCGYFAGSDYARDLASRARIAIQKAKAK